MDGLPAILGFEQAQNFLTPASNLKPIPYIPQMLVVGAVDTDGKAWPKSNSGTLPPGLPNIWAPGVGVWAAEANKVTLGTRAPTRFKKADGTSICKMSCLFIAKVS